MARDQERVARAQQPVLVGGLPEVPGIGVALGSGGIQRGRSTTLVALHVCRVVFVTVTSKPDFSCVGADGE